MSGQSTSLTSPLLLPITVRKGWIGSTDRGAVSDADWPETSIKAGPNPPISYNSHGNREYISDARPRCTKVKKDKDQRSRQRTFSRYVRCELEIY